MMKVRYLVLVGVWILRERLLRERMSWVHHAVLWILQVNTSLSLSFFLYQSYSFLLFFLVSFSFDPTTAYLLHKLLIFSLR